ncbi:MAG: LysM peptidoglycan-binding domain-containing protein [Bacteroidales bacterium]|nr:LysM peptidoglycan-binding domain-containing protein [Bacteroidales bacterium]
MIFLQNHLQLSNGNNSTIGNIFIVNLLRINVHKSKSTVMIKIWLIILFSLTISLSFSQATVTKSTTTTTEKGVVYYVHTVETGQTIYGITKAYSVSEDVLLKQNPELKDGLKAGMTLKIPKKEIIANDLAEPVKEIATTQPKTQKIHEVVQGETLYKIMSQYGVTLEDLQLINPGLNANLKIGQKIIIPDSETIRIKKLSQKYDSLFTYTVQKRDNFSKLKRKFKVSKEELEELNPILIERGLIEGMVLHLPFKDGIKEEITEEAVVLEPIKDTVKPVAVKPKVDSLPTIKNKRPIKVGLMMPIYTHLAKEINTDNEFLMKPAHEYHSFRFIHYYEGFMLAVDSLAKMGYEIEVFVYDTKADSATTVSLVSKPEFASLDIIFGPFFARNLKIVVPAAAKNGTLVISPFSSGIGLDGYSNLFISETSDYSLWKLGFNYLRDSLPDANVYIIHSDLRPQIETASYLKRLYFNINSDTARLKAFSYSAGGSKALFESLSPTRVNFIINLSSNEAAISNFVRQLNQKREHYPIVLLGLHDHWSKFTTLEDEYLVNLRLTLLSNSFIDYRQPFIKDFTELFYKNYLIDPQLIAFKGFDQGMYFMQLVGSYGKSFSSTLPKSDYKPVQSYLNFTKTPSGKWINTEGSVYQYFNYELNDKRKPVEIIKPDMESPAPNEPDTKTQNQ